MYKIFLFILVFLSFSSSVFSNDENRMVIYGHVYKEDQTNPLNKVTVNVERFGKVLGTGETNPSGYYEVLLEESTEDLNICIYGSAGEASIQSVCHVLVPYHGRKDVIDNIIIMRYEDTFFIGKDGKDLNEQFIEDIDHLELEEKIDQYNENIRIAEERKEEDIALEQKQKELDALKAKYKMPPNSEMTGPLKSILIKGSLNNVGDKASLIDPDQVYITVQTHNGEVLKEVRLNDNYDFRFDLKPKGNDVFLHAPVLIVESIQTQTINDKKIKLFKNFSFPLTKEFEILNITLEPYEASYLDNVKNKRKSLLNLLIEISIIILIMVLGVFVMLRDKNDNIIKDYK